MRIQEERVWAGSEASLQAALEGEAAIAARMAAGNYDDENEDEGPRLLQITDGIATVTIRGSLVNSDSFLLQYFGMTGYPEIREAVLAAAEDPEVKHILLDIDSGGGAVSGVDDTAKLIRLVNDRVKPVTTYTDGTMASAAYWLGSAAGNVYSSKSALVGSIGVIATHKEYVEAYKKEGIGVTVVRAGKYKALANSNEKLTEEGKAQIQKVVDAAYDIFVEHVASMRGKSFEYADKTMADGQEFIGQAAVDVGLTDGLMTYDALVTDLQEKSVAQSQKLMDNRRIDSHRLSGQTSTEISGDSQMAKKALTEADIAALAAGASPSVVVAETPETPVAAEVANVEQTDTKPETVVEGAANGVQEGEGQEVASAQAEEVASAQAEEVAKNDTTVQFLNAQIRERDESLLQANVKLAKLGEELDELKASTTPMLDIVAHSISNMRIAMGGSEYNAEGASPAQVLAEHARVSDEFKKKFKVGGVAAVSAEQPAEKAQEASPRHLARVNAVRFTK